MKKSKNHIFCFSRCPFLLGAKRDSAAGREAASLKGGGEQKVQEELFSVSW